MQVANSTNDPYLPQPARCAVDETTGVPRRAWLFLYTAIAALYLLNASGRIGGSDALFMYNVTQSIATEGSLSAEPCKFEPRTNGCVPGVDGRHYAGFGLIPSIVAVPAYWAGRVLSSTLHRDEHVIGGFCLSMYHALFAAWAPIILGLWITRIGLPFYAGALTALLYALASPAWLYSKGFYSEPYFAMGLLGCCCFLASSERFLAVLLAGASFGFACGARVYGLILAPVIVLYAVLLWRSRGRDLASIFKNLLLLGAPMALAVALIAYSNYARFGSVLKTGYQLNFPTLADLMSTPLLTGATGLLMDAHVGILWYVPWVLIVPFVWKQFWSRHRNEAILVLGMFLVNYVFFAKYAVWNGGWALGPRMLYATIPFLALPIAALIARGPAALRTPIGKAAVALVAVALLIQLIQVPYPVSRYFTMEVYNKDHNVRSVWSGKPLLEAVIALPELLFGVGNQDSNPAHQYLLTFDNSVNLLRADLWLLKIRLFGVPAAAAFLVAAALLSAFFLSLRATLRQFAAQRNPAELRSSASS